MSSDRPPVVIAVVTVGPREMLAGTLRSMRADAEAGLAEVWVVDNGSTDGSDAMVRREFGWAHLVRPDVNLGYGRAVNLVAERTSSDWIAPANDDIELQPGALARLIETGEAHPGAGVVAPRLEHPDGTTQHSVHAFPTLGFTVAFNLGLYRLNRRAAERRCLEGAWDETVAREVPWAMATFMIVRRPAFESVGGFSARQFMHAEDVDLAWRLARSGSCTRYEPAATVLHHGSVSTTRAYGDELQRRWSGATYSWLARERGLTLARAVALVNVAGAAARWAGLSALALFAPARFGPARDAARGWVAAHRTGLRARRELLGEH